MTNHSDGGQKNLALLLRSPQNFATRRASDNFVALFSKLVIFCVIFVHRSLQLLDVHCMVKAKEITGRFSIAKVCGSYEQLAQDNDVDIAVYVNRNHPSYSL